MAALIPPEILIEIPRMKYLCSSLPALDGPLFGKLKKFIAVDKKMMHASVGRQMIKGSFSEYLYVQGS